jgi:mannose/fructose/N-acetylgalactosamine-specific phosphotransferase system component IIC
MISRPVVAGPLAGLLVGDPVTGMWAGGLLEILSLHQLPIGASRGWDTGPGAVAAAVAAVSLEGYAGLLVGVGFGVVVGWAGSWSVHVMRCLNARLVVDQVRVPLTPSRLTVRHLSAMMFDLARAIVLTLVAILTLRLLASPLGAVPMAATVGAALLMLAAASLGLGVDLGVMVRGRRARTALGVGLCVSLILGLWLG